MAVANTVITIKKSLVGGNTPPSLANGEIAINQVDGKLYYRTPGGTINYITNSQSFATINSNNSLILAGTPTDTLTIVPGNNISIATNTSSKTITISSTASGGGVFNYWQNTAPTSSNSHDYWTNSDTGVMYENFGNTTNPVWAEVGPTGLLNNTAPGQIVGTQLNVAYYPANTTGVAIQVSAANTKGGAGYADVIQLTNTSGGATNPNKFFRVNITGGLEIINSAYTSTSFQLLDSGDLTISGNTTFNGIAPGYGPNRPAFRIIGGNTTNSLTTTQNGNGALNINNWSIDYIQGSYLNTTSGVFTAPAAGLYQVNVVGRNSGYTSGISQLCTVKNATGGNGSGGAVLTMIEWAANSSMNHAGGSSVTSMNPGDTLALKVLAGTVNFDSNDNWSVAYLG